MTSHDKAMSMARKLHELSKRGVGGEAANAAQMLDRFLRKTGLTLADIDEDARKEYCWRFKGQEHKRFIGQVISSVAGDAKPYRWRAKPNALCAELTALEYAEVVIRLDHYWQLWQEESRLFYAAFIQANKLYTKPDPDKQVNQRELTPEEEEEVHRLLEKMRAVRTTTPNKRIGAAQ